MYVAGVDEAGRGPLAGPVIAAAVILSNKVIPGLKDSKKLTKKELSKLDVIIRNEAISFNISEASVLEIEKINILEASLLAMTRAINGLKVKPDIVLVDGSHAPKSVFPIKAIIKGDTKEESIMAASILAKVTRDKIMIKLDRFFPQYGFKSHKGYPTEFHIMAIKNFGICKHHRRTFKPIKNLDNILNNES